MIYGKIGDTSQQIGGNHPGPGWVEMAEPRPTPESVAQFDGKWGEKVPTSKDVRNRRDELLRACDWTQMPDAPLDDEARSVWTVYRQALRDVPQQAGFPEAVTWPHKPEVA